jgi:TonB family protein
VIARALAVSLALATLNLICPSLAAQGGPDVSVSPVDYPPGVSPGDSERRVRLRYRLDQAGRVVGCGVIGRSGEPALDAESCRILTTRARIRSAPGQREGQISFLWAAEGQDKESPRMRGEPLAFNLVSLHRIAVSDYPAAAHGRSGTVTYAVTVSPTGLPRDCTVTISSGVEALDRRTCDIIMTRAIYIPAEVDGAPTTGITHGRIRWQNPG